MAATTSRRPQGRRRRDEEDAKKKQYQSQEHYRKLARAGFRRGFAPSEQKAARLAKTGAIRARYLGEDAKVQSGLQSMRLNARASRVASHDPPKGFSMATSLAAMTAHRARIRTIPLLRRRAQESKQRDDLWRADPNSHGGHRPQPFAPLVAELVSRVSAMPTTSASARPSRLLAAAR